MSSPLLPSLIPDLMRDRDAVFTTDITTAETEYTVHITKTTVLYSSGQMWCLVCYICTILAFNDPLDSTIKYESWASVFTTNNYTTHKFYTTSLTLLYYKWRVKTSIFQSWTSLLDLVAQSKKLTKLFMVPSLGWVFWQSSPLVSSDSSCAHVFLRFTLVYGNSVYAGKLFIHECRYLIIVSENHVSVSFTVCLDFCLQLQFVCTRAATVLKNGWRQQLRVILKESPNSSNPLEFSAVFHSHLRCFF